MKAYYNIIETIGHTPLVELKTIEIAQKNENQNKIVVVLLPDAGERYLSTELFNE